MSEGIAPAARTVVNSTDPDRPLGGAFGTLTLRELYVGLALLGHAASGKRDIYPGRRAAEDAADAANLVARSR